MRIRTFLLIAIVALAAALAACGEAIPTASAHAVAPAPVVAPTAFQPVFTTEGKVLRDGESGLMICDFAPGAEAAARLSPAFSPDGTVRRCSGNGSALYSAERDGEPVLVRDPRR